MRNYFYLVCLMTMLLSACVSSNKHVAGQGSPLVLASKNIAVQINSKTDILNRSIQISPNNFWERNTRINLPFSTVLSDTISAELSRLGAGLSVQESGLKPLKVIGNYQTAKNDMIITITLREMGDTASRDLAVIQERLHLKDTDPNWLKPDFGRMARTMIRLMEEDYTGGMVVRLRTVPFKPGSSSQAELILGDEFEKYIKDALASSPVFKAADGMAGPVKATLRGDYAVMNGKMVFHAAVVSNTGDKVMAGAAFESGLAHIPNALLLPKNTSIHDLAENAAESIIRQYRTTIAGLAGNQKISILKNNFHDSGQKSIIPLSHLMADKLKTLLANDSMFTVEDEPSTDTNLILSGHFYRDDIFLFVNISLDQILPGPAGTQLINLGRAEEKMGKSLCPEKLFDVDLKGKTAYLMQVLEKKSVSMIPGSLKSEIVINRFKYENSKEYSKFSDFLEGYILDYFTSSRYFSPVKNLEQRLVRLKHSNHKPVVQGNKTAATLTALADAEYFVDGTFWPRSDGQLEIKAVLSKLNGSILASEHILYAKDIIDPSWFDRPGPSHYQASLDTVSAGESGLSIELLTQKGRNNLSFKTGEEMIFFLKANKTVYVNIFTSDADHQIFKIFPNRFTGAYPLIRAGEVTLIPDNSYNTDFMFQVRGKTGHEMIFAFASDQPLPELPSTTDTGIFGLKMVGLNVKDIKNYFTRYTRQTGASLSWDSLSIRTH